VLTVDFDRLGVCPGDRLLDLGCGGGRHAFEAARRGAHVVALDARHPELDDAGAVLAAMEEKGELPSGAPGLLVQADALALPFPDRSFDRIIAAEVLEHIPEDTRALGELARVLRPGGTMAVTVPHWLPERICWALSEQYHTVEGGHVRIYRAGGVRKRLDEAGLAPTSAHHAHGLHSPYWWLRCALGIDNDRRWAVRLYHRLLVWDIVRRPVPTRLLDRALTPVIGKSLVVYARRAPGAMAAG
jgi:SAM-dependent methyltransferase